MGLKKKIKGMFLLAAVLCGTGLTSNVYGAEITLPDSSKIMHAGGVVEGFRGTNSMEALQNSFFNGYRFIELDFCFTTDGHLVSLHDWNENYFGAAYASYFNGAVSLNDFRNKRIIGAYTPVTLENLQDWILGKPETYIITDIKTDNIKGLRYIKENYPLLVQRIIPQIYTESQYNEVKGMGYENIIYTLYAQSFEDKVNTNKINNFALNNKLIAIVFDKELANPSYVKELAKSRTKLFVHTVNDESEQRRYMELGINGVYSDVY